MTILGRDGNVSFIRLGTLAAIIGVLIILGGLALFFVDRANHQRPFDIEPPAGSALWFSADKGGNARQVVYRVQGANADDIAAYYQRKLLEFGGNNGDKCVRFPSIGNYTEYDGGNREIPPFRWSCMFDNSGFQISQSTRVNIEPGTEANDSVGMVVIENEQYWQR
ncbi:MAG: hypothetical protein LCI00_01565 [Chloroflexi bacterium]|nr:hypothetical protein [Chloroflexota bacterium]MCC6895620.1 hypothetical protein [Anaerolineae bacterium]